MFVGFANATQAQKENNVWVGGDYVGLDFNSGSPALLERPAGQNIWRTNAAICDSDGHLLFYTNGYRVFNRNFQIMPNGDNLNIGDYVQWGYDELSVHDGAAIVPVPAHPGQYYVFHEDLNFADFDTFTSSQLPTHLFSCVVDMALDNGNGAVVGGQKDLVMLSDTLVETGFKVIKHGNGRDYWLLCHEAGSDRFYRFLIDPAGIHGPYEQHTGAALTGFDAFFHDVMAINNDGSKLTQLRTLETEIDLYDFNRCTGELYNPRTFSVHDSAFYLMGAAFSPSGKYLYVTANYWDDLFQFDVTAADIAASRQLISVFSGATNPFNTDYDHLALAPDGKIYVNTYGGNRSLHVIHQPDSAGLACDFEENGLSVNPPGINWRSVPNVVNYSLGPLYGSGCDTLTSTKALPTAAFTLGVYPNPFSNELQLSVGGLTTKAMVEITDVLGRTVYSNAFSPSGYSIHRGVDVSLLSSGVYVLTLTANNERLVRKVVKK